MKSPSRLYAHIVLEALRDTHDRILLLSSRRIFSTAHAAQRRELRHSLRVKLTPDADELPGPLRSPLSPMSNASLNSPLTPPKPWAWLEETSADVKAGSEDSDGLVGQMKTCRKKARQQGRLPASTGKTNVVSDSDMAIVVAEHISSRIEKSKQARATSAVTTEVKPTPGRLSQSLKLLIH